MVKIYIQPVDFEDTMHVILRPHRIP